MKKIIATLAFSLFLTIGLMAQNPPHPNGGSAPGGGNTPVGGGAPLDGGIVLLIALGTVYGGRRVYKLVK